MTVADSSRSAPEISRRRNRMASIAAVFAVAAVGGLAAAGPVWAEITAIGAQAAYRTVPLTAVKHPSTDLVAEQAQLQSALSIIRKANGGAVPSASSAYRELVSSGDFHSIGVVSSAGDAQGSTKTVDVEQLDGKALSIYAPAYSARQALELRLAPGAAPRWLDHQENNEFAALGLIVLTVLTALGAIGAGGAAATKAHKLGRKIGQKRSWRQLVHADLLGPSKPRVGFRILNPERQSWFSGNEEQLSFVARQYEFQGADGWADCGVQRYPGSDRVWTGTSDVTEMAAAWVEFCTAVARTNAERWQEQLQRERPPAAKKQKLSLTAPKQPTLRDVLPAAKAVVDLGTIETDLHAGR